jgi:phage shock protein PspC (stress-responsive transcriptional regulator)/FtsH-binding integral membrane protein
VLRRSRADRVGAGVAGGLGRYFNVDPVLFRVLFAVAAFFGGAGVLAYVIAWAAIPEEGAVNAPVDRIVGELRRRHVPIWLVGAIGAIVLWAVAFSWWAPGPFFPVMIVVILLVAVFGHRGRMARREDAATPDGTATVSLEKEAPADPNAPEWVSSTRAWIVEAKQASRDRRRRAFPVRIGVLATLVVTLTILGIADATSGIRLPVYFWVTGGIVAVGLLIGLALRRTPWSMLPLLVPALAGTIAFGNTHASLHDGVGQSDWTPTSVSQLKADYRLAFGKGTLDLRSIGTVSDARNVDITMGAGQVKILLPPTMNATVHANVRIGEIDVDGDTVADTAGGNFHRVHGYDIDHTVVPPIGATGPAVTITVHLADGNVTVNHQN